MKTLKLNHAAIWVTIVLSQLIPLGWYAIFADRWPTATNVFDKYIAVNQSNWLFVVSLLGSLVAIYVLAWLFKRLPVTNAQSGLVIGVIIGAILNVFSLMTINMFAANPLEMALIDGGVNVIVYGVAGLILGSWRKYEEHEPGAKPQEPEVELTGSSGGTNSPGSRP